MQTFLIWANAFVWTNALEAPLWVWLLRRVPGPWWRPLVVLFACNVATHPVFTAWQLAARPSALAILAAEGVIALAEGTLCAAWLAGRVHAPRPWRTGIGAGLAANAFSYGAALVASSF